MEKIESNTPQSLSIEPVIAASNETPNVVSLDVNHSESVTIAESMNETTKSGDPNPEDSDFLDPEESSDIPCVAVCGNCNNCGECIMCSQMAEQKVFDQEFVNINNDDATMNQEDEMAKLLNTRFTIYSYITDDYLPGTIVVNSKLNCLFDNMNSKSHNGPRLLDVEKMSSRTVTLRDLLEKGFVNVGSADTIENLNIVYSVNSPILNNTNTKPTVIGRFFHGSRKTCISVPSGIDFQMIPLSESDTDIELSENTPPPAPATPLLFPNGRPAHLIVVPGEQSVDEITQEVTQQTSIFAVDPIGLVARNATDDFLAAPPDINFWKHLPYKHVLAQSLDDGVTTANESKHEDSDSVEDIDNVDYVSIVNQYEAPLHNIPDPGVPSDELIELPSLADEGNTDLARLMQFNDAVMEQYNETLEVANQFLSMGLLSESESKND